MVEGWKGMLQEPAILTTAIVTFTNYFSVQHGPTSHALTLVSLQGSTTEQATPASLSYPCHG